MTQADPFATAVPAQSAVTSNNDDPFAAPAPTSDSPRMRDLLGRLLLVRPHKVETVANTAKGAKPGETQERATVDVIVLDGDGPIAFGGHPEDADDPTPHTKSVAVPYRMNRRYDSHKAIVGKCLAVLDDPKLPRWILGRLVLGEKKEGQRRALILANPTDADYAVARAYNNAHPLNVDPFAG